MKLELQEFSPVAQKFLRKKALEKQQQTNTDAEATTQRWLDYIDVRIGEHLDHFEKQLLEVAAKQFELEALKKELADLKQKKQKIVLIDSQALDRQHHKSVQGLQWLIDRRVRKALNEEKRSNC